MPAPPLAVLGVGLVSGLGLTAESCAAIRCGINNFQETRFIGSSGDWLVGSAVELEEPWRGMTKLSKMAARAVRECFDAAPEEAPERQPGADRRYERARGEQHRDQYGERDSPRRRDQCPVTGQGIEQCDLGCAEDGDGE